MLVHLAGVLVRAVRNEDVVARFGGEEILIILRSISLDLAMTLGERLRRTVERSTVKHGDKDIATTVSIGVVRNSRIDFDRWPEMSMPISRITWMASGCT